MTIGADPHAIDEPVASRDAQRRAALQEGVGRKAKMKIPIETTLQLFSWRTRTYSQK